MTEQVLPELLPTSRFQIMPSPIVSPGKCAVCGAVDQPVIDFGLNIDFYGAVLICVTSCVPEAARAIGMVDIAAVKAAEAGLAQSLEENLEAQNLVAITREQFDVINMAVSGLSDVLLFARPSSVDVVAESADENSDNAESTDEQEQSGDTGSSEQDDNSAVGEGSFSLSSSDFDGDFKL